MSKRHVPDDWSNDSASLFREARRAHDPTPAESAQLAAVFARIQAGKAASVAANGGADLVAREAASKLLRQVAGVSLGVVCIAAASIAFIRADRPASEPARSATPAPTAVASAPPPSAMQPPLVPSDEPSTSAPSATPRDEAPKSRSRSQRRRARTTAEKQRSSRIELARVPEAPSSAARDDSTAVAEPENSETRHAPAARRSTLKAAAAAVPAAAPRATSNESEHAEAERREAHPILPEAAPTELALMKRIQRALRDADFSKVLALCAEHARRWPHGVFEREREGVRAIAACGADLADAALRAERFLTAHPHASVAMRVSAACATQLMRR